MKKSFVLLIALSFFVAACNNNKAGKKNSGNREKDDYGKSDNRDINDEKKNEEKTGSNVNEDNNKSIASGWPQTERDAFTSNCERTFMQGGRSRSEAQSYCGCMLNKMENLFPDINDLATLTDEDFKSPAMKKMAAECLKRE